MPRVPKSLIRPRLFPSPPFWFNRLEFGIFSIAFRYSQGNLCCFSIVFLYCSITNISLGTWLFCLTVGHLDVCFVRNNRFWLLNLHLATLEQFWLRVKTETTTESPTNCCRCSELCDLTYSDKLSRCAAEHWSICLNLVFMYIFRIVLCVSRCAPDQELIFNKC